MKLKYNLQFFAEGEGDGNDSGNVDDDIDSTTGNNEDRLDVEAFADLISEKDKQIEQLQKDVAELKKSNAKLTIMVNSDHNSSGKKSFEENLLNMVGAKPRKEK